MRRVVVTGAGTVNPLGHDLPQTMAAMRAGSVAIGPLDFPLVERLLIRIGAQASGWQGADHLPRGDIAVMDRYAQFAAIAAAEAMAQAGLEGGFDPLRAGVVLGTGAGGAITLNDSYREVYEQGKSRVHPFTVPRLMPNAAAAHLAMRHGLKGPVMAVSTACASSNHAFALGLTLIQGGMADLVLAGGADATLCFGGLKAWEGLRVMSPDGCRPFCATRNGMVLGEGAGVLVLEAEEHARARGARVLAVLAGAAMTSDAGDLVAPSAEGAARAMQGALAQAGLRPADLGYVNAHGTGTRLNDLTEAGALAAVFGEGGVPVSSTKGMHGHLLGGAGAVEVIACLLALDGHLPANAGCTAPDPDCPVDLVTGPGRAARPDAVMSNAFAFGGMNASIVLTRP